MKTIPLKKRATAAWRILTQSRGIAAASRGPLSHRFHGQWGTPDAEMRFDLPSVRARSREMANSPVLTSFRSAVLNNVLGPNGMHFQGKVKTAKYFGDSTDGQSDKQANDIIETAYKEASHRDNYLVSRDMSKRLADELKLNTIIFDGECFIRTWKPFDNAIGIARQIIDADLVDVNLNEPNLAGGGHIRMGIEFDAWGARVAYHILKRHPLDYQYGQNLRHEYERVAAVEMRHLFIPLRPGQTRGLPLTAPALLSVRQLEAFVDAAVVNARIGAARNIYYTKQFPEGWTAGDGLPSSFCDADGRDTGAIVDDLREGESLELPTGVDAKTLDTRFPNGETEAFTRAAMRFNAMGLGTSYMTLSNDLSQANFSSLRAGLNEERSTWSRWQQFFIEADCEPDFMDFLRYGLATQFIKLPQTKLRKFSAMSFTGRRWSSVNPLQDIQADKEAIAALLMSPQEAIMARGRDPEEVLDEIKEFRDMAEARELNGEDTTMANTGAGGPIEETTVDNPTEGI